MINDIDPNTILIIAAGAITAVGSFIFTSQVKLAKVVEKLDTHLDQAAKDHDLLHNIDKRVTVLESS